MDGIPQQRMLEKCLHVLVDLFGIHAQTEHDRAFNLEDGKLTGKPFPESRGTLGSTVVVAQDDATRLDHRRGLISFRGKSRHAVADIAEDDFGRGAIWP